MAIKGEDFSADRMATEYLNYLFEEYAGNRHVRRVASWLGLLILGIEKLKDRWWVSHIRQLCFEVGGVRYKVKYNHKAGPRGGIEIVEIEAARGQPEIKTIRAILNLEDAAKFYHRPKI